MKHSKLNSVFLVMKDRCYNPKCKQYEDYGGRGIVLCDEWNNREIIHMGRHGRYTKGWIAFKKWALSHGYKEGLSIDRIDVNGIYSPENCRWADRKMQNNNKRANLYVTYKGRTQTLAQWCEELGLIYDTVRCRLNDYHYSVEEAFETKENPRLRFIEWKGKRQSLASWCRELNLNYKTVNVRLNKLHWPVEKAFSTKTKIKD